ncbi:serine/threonine protein kinase, partial [Myxococcota bacterium]|nr:serine/threonine protein kinase [Myxococcota bacterium]
HSAKVVHRDLKPANIVCFDHRNKLDIVKVLDFGIAKIIDPDEDYQPLTREGIVCGTPAYMSPEQVQGLELDARSDLFSLGIILYQTLTGQLPFFAESAVEVATKIVIETPKPPSSVRSDWSYPPELEQITLRLLAKKKEDRFHNAMAVKEALDQCLYVMQMRQDASLDMRPDEVAELLSDVDAPIDGAETLRFTSKDVSRAMNAEAKAQGLSGQPRAPHHPDMTQPVQRQGQRAAPRKKSNASSLIILLLLAILAGGGYYAYINNLLP